MNGQTLFFINISLLFLFYYRKGIALNFQMVWVLTLSMNFRTAKRVVGLSVIK